MANVGPPTLSAPQPPLASQPPTQPIPQEQSVYVPQLNSSHFKPEFAGNPDEDEEAHLLRTNDWMDAHQFQEGVKVQFFCSH